jgi:pyruvate-formate lyase-activating enzyme
MGFACPGGYRIPKNSSKIRSSARIEGCRPDKASRAVWGRPPDLGPATLACQFGKGRPRTEPETAAARGSGRIEGRRPPGSIGLGIAVTGVGMRHSEGTGLNLRPESSALPGPHEPPGMDKRIAVLFLLPQCNMSCRFCITQDGFRIMSEAQARGLLDSLAGMGVRNVIFGGGEPLAWPYDIVAAARHAKGLGMLVQIGTNGIRLSRHLIRASEVDRFILPLESADPLVHDALRIAKGGHHALILSRLEALREAGRSVTVSTVITTENRAGLRRLGEYLASYVEAGGRLHAWHLYRFLAQGRGGSCAPSLGMSLERYREECFSLQAGFPELPILKRPDMTKSASVGFYWMESDGPRFISPFGFGSH